MARRRPAAGRDRGGGAISPARWTRPGLIAALASLIGSVGPATVLTVTTAGYWVPVAAAGALGVVLLAIALLAAWPSAVWMALIALAGQYGSWLMIRHARVDPRAAVVAIAIFLVAESAYLSLERAVPPTVVAARLRRTAAIGVAGATLALSLLVAVATLPAISAIPLDVLGVVAATVIVVLLARLSR